MNPGFPYCLQRTPLEWNMRVLNGIVAAASMLIPTLKVALEMANLTAATLGLDPKEVFVASTGVIGQPLDMKKIRAGAGIGITGIGHNGPGPLMKEDGSCTSICGGGCGGGYG